MEYCFNCNQFIQNCECDVLKKYAEQHPNKYHGFNKNGRKSFTPMKTPQDKARAELIGRIKNHLTNVGFVGDHLLVAEITADFHTEMMAEERREIEKKICYELFNTIKDCADEDFKVIVLEFIKLKTTP